VCQRVEDEIADFLGRAHNLSADYEGRSLVAEKIAIDKPGPLISELRSADDAALCFSRVVQSMMQYIEARTPEYVQGDNGSMDGQHFLATNLARIWHSVACGFTGSDAPVGSAQDILMLRGCGISFNSMEAEYLRGRSKVSCEGKDADEETRAAALTAWDRQTRQRLFFWYRAIAGAHCSVSHLFNKNKQVVDCPRRHLRDSHMYQ
jgi:hypothetical protein